MNGKLAGLMFGTRDTLGALVLRLGVAVVIWPHGAQKLLGWFGGSGFSGTMQSFTESMNIPSPLAFLVVLTEFFGPILLVLGFLTRLVSLAITVLMIVAAVMVHLPHGFFMNWYQQKDGEGFEYHILVVSMSLSLMILGGGRWALDTILHRRITGAGSDEDQAAHQGTEPASAS